MDLYSRYNDKDGRLFVIIKRTANIDVQVIPYAPGNVKAIMEPSTITLLDVHAEKAQESPFKDVERWIDKGLLKRI